jgi:hypothetical protein
MLEHVYGVVAWQYFEQISHSTLAFVLFYFSRISYVAGNTFIFSDGTVVQQEDGPGRGDILLYVLDPTDVTIDPGY